MPNPTITCDFYRDCNIKPKIRFTYHTSSSTPPQPAFLNIMIEPSQKEILAKVNDLLASVQPTLGSNLMPLVASINSPFVYAMQYLLGFLEGQCSTTYKDSNGTITFGVGLNLSIKSNACPIQLLNSTYSTLNLNFAALSTEIKQPQPPLSCEQVNVLLYATLAGNCTAGTSSERAFVPYMWQLQDFLTAPTCNLGDTLLTPDQIAMLLSMYFNGGKGLLGSKLCLALYQGDIDAAIRQVVLYSNVHLNKDLQNRQTFMGNFLRQDVQLPWSQYEKIAATNSLIVPRFGEPTNGLPYGNDQLSFQGNSTIQAIHSDEPNKNGQYTSTSNDLIVYGTPTNDLISFSSGGSIVVFGGNGDDILEYTYPMDVPGSTWDNSFSYLAGNTGFDYYLVSSLSAYTGGIQINDPDGGAIISTLGPIAGIIDMDYIINVNDQGTILLDPSNKNFIIANFLIKPNYISIDIEQEKDNSITSFNIKLFDFVSGNYGIFISSPCTTHFTYQGSINAINIGRYLSLNTDDVTNQVFDQNGLLINQFVVTNSQGESLVNPNYIKLNNGYLSYVFTEYVTVNSPYQYKHQIFGRIYNQDGIEVSTLTPSSSYPAIQFCPTSGGNPVDACDISIGQISALNNEYQAIAYIGTSYFNHTCAETQPYPCAPMYFLKLYDETGQAYPSIVNLPITNSYPLGVFGNSLNNLTIVYSDSDTASVYIANMYINQCQFLKNITTWGLPTVSSFDNGFIMIYSDYNQQYYRTIYNGYFNTQSMYGFVPSDSIYNININNNVVLISSFQSYQLITTNNQNIGSGHFSGSCYMFNLGLFKLNNDTILVSGYNPLNSTVCTFNIPIEGISKFNIPPYFPQLPPINNQANFTAIQNYRQNQISIGRNLLSINILEDSKSPPRQQEMLVTSTASRLKPPSVDWTAVGLVAKHLIHELPSSLEAGVNAYINPVLWLFNIAKQELYDAYQQLQQMQKQISRGLISETELTDCRSPYSSCMQMLLNTPQLPLPRVDGIREFRAYDPHNRQLIFNVDAFEIGTTKNKHNVIGSLSFFGERKFCRYPDGQHNLIKQTGIFSHIKPEITSHTELCIAPPPKEASVFDGVGHAVIQGGLAGTRSTMDAFMQRQGYSEKTSYFVSGIAFYATLWLVFFIEHSLEAQAVSEIMQEDTNINILAAIRACLSIIQVLLMLGIGTSFTTSSRYAGERIQEAGWPKMGTFVREAGDKLGKMLPYVDSWRQRGLLNTVVCASTGLATQLGIDRIGNYFVNKM